MPRVPLNETITIKLSPIGGGQAKIGPLSARETWYPNNAHVSCNTAVIESKCTIYAGADTTQSNFRDESVVGSSGDSTGAIGADVLKPGQYIIAVWTGADANALATLSVVGSKDV